MCWAATAISVETSLFRHYDGISQALSPYGGSAPIGKDTGREGFGIPELIARDKVVVTVTTV